MSEIREASVSVVAVRIEYAGAQLVGDHASGVSELVVDDAFEFNEGGGSLLVDGDTLTYTGWDDDTNTIALSSATSSAYEADTPVRLVPSTPIKVADVVDITGASFPALVWHTLDPLLREGIRDPEDQETGTIFYSGDHEKVWLVNCPGKVASIDPAAIEGGGGGGDIDGGNDDDSFVLPTLAEYVLDGEPDFWVTALPGGTVYTEDEAYEAFDNPYFLWFEFAAGSMTWDTPWVDLGGTFDAVMIPAWSVPLLGQDEKVTVDSATVAGLASSPPVNSALSAEIVFGSMYDHPDGRSFSQINHYLLTASHPVATTIYDNRTWYEVNGNGDFAMPASSDAATFPTDGDLHYRGIVVVYPGYAGASSDPGLTTSMAFTGVRMVQA